MWPCVHVDLKRERATLSITTPVGGPAGKDGGVRKLHCVVLPEVPG